MSGNGGSQAGNQLSNADCAASTGGWLAATTSALPLAFTFNLAGNALGGGPGTCYFVITGTPANATVGFGQNQQLIPIIAGQYYEASAYLGVVNTTGTAYVIVNFLNSAGALVNQVLGSSCTSANGGGLYLINYCRSGLIAQAGANAVSAQFYVWENYTGTGTTPYLFWVHSYFGQASATQTQLSAWVPPGQTSITGGLIQTNTITADKISVGTLSALSANMGTLTAGSITGGTINGATINVPAGNSGAGLLGIGSANLYYFGGQLNETAPVIFLGAVHVNSFSGGGAQTACFDNNGLLYTVGSGVAC